MEIRIHTDTPLLLRIEQVNPAAESSSLLTEGDREHLATLMAPARRAQWSTARTMLRRELGEEGELRYASSGALVLSKPVGDYHYLSISHTENWVAVMFCAKRCGVDIESIDRNFNKVASRYISPDEHERLKAKVGEIFEGVMWSAKEALYKYGNQTGVDFTHDMVVTDINTEEGIIYAELYGRATPPIYYRIVDDQIICFVFG